MTNKYQIIERQQMQEKMRYWIYLLIPEQFQQTKQNFKNYDLAIMFQIHPMFQNILAPLFNNIVTTRGTSQYKDVVSAV